MTSSPAGDPLVALWQATPAVDSRPILEDLGRQRRLHRRLNLAVWTVLVGSATLLMFEEATGGIGSHGVLSAAWVLVLVVIGICRFRDRQRLPEVLTLDTRSLLQAMIKKARADLFIARCLYAGAPLGAVAGYLLAGLVGVGSPGWPRLHLHPLPLGAGIALAVMVVAGVLLARSCTLQVRNLGHKLKMISDDP